MPYPASTIPLGYTTPSFPSLYWPIRAPPGSAQYLYSTTDVWRFTLYWTLITFGLVHGAVAAWAVLMQFHSANAQRKALRRGDGGINHVGGSSGGGGRRSEKKSGTTRGGADEDAEDEDEGSINSRQRDVSNDEHGPDHGRLFPQPLLVSSSPVLSTLGWVWLIPVVYLVVGGLEALLSGSLVGLVIGAVYNAGYFKMSTWMPFLWGIINCLIVILGSFRIQGGL